MFPLSSRAKKVTETYTSLFVCMKSPRIIKSRLVILVKYFYLSLYNLENVLIQLKIVLQLINMFFKSTLVRRIEML